MPAVGTASQRADAPRRGAGGRWALALAAAACGDPGSARSGAPAHSLPGAPPAGDDAAVARVDGRAIALAQLQAAVTAEGAGASAREVLDRLVTLEVVAAEAERRALAGDPEVRDTARRRAVQRLLEDEVEARTRLQDVPERHVRDAFERNRGLYKHPDLLGAIHLVVRIGKADPPERKEAGRVLAHALRAEVAALPPEGRTIDALRAIAAAHKGSTPTVKAEDLGFIAKASRLVPEFIEAAFALREDGAVGPVTWTQYGWHVIVRTGWKGAIDRPYEDVAAEVRARLHPEWQQAEAAQFVEALRDRAAPEVFPADLAPLQAAEGAPPADAPPGG